MNARSIGAEKKRMNKWMGIYQLLSTDTQKQEQQRQQHYFWLGMPSLSHANANANPQTNLIQRTERVPRQLADRRREWW